MVWGLQPGAALIVVRLAVVTLLSLSTAPEVAGCRLVGCSVVSRRSLRSLAVSGVSHAAFPRLPGARCGLPCPVRHGHLAGAGSGSHCGGVFGGEEEGGDVRSGSEEARTTLLLHIISVRPSKQPLMVRTFLKVYMELGSYSVFARTMNEYTSRRRSEA